ncbi:MAG: hypothetical protein U0174_12430 [Polyangiaceae bacterium]
MSSRLLSLTVLASLPILASLGAFACASTNGADDGNSEQVSANDLSGSAVLTVGPISVGQTKSAAYNKTPKWRAFSFTANKGDTAEFWVRSTVGGDAEAFVVTSQFVTLASNFDADATTKNARVSAVIPKTGNYYIVFRDSSAKATTFAVEYVKPAPIVRDAGAADSGNTDSGVDSGPPPVTTNDPFDPASCPGATMTVDQAKWLASNGDSYEHALRPNRLGRYELKHRTRTCDLDGNNCGPWNPTIDAKWQGGYLGLGYGGSGFTLRGGVRIDTEGGLRIRVVDDSIDMSPMYYPQSVALQLSGNTGPVTAKAAYDDYQFGAPDLNNGGQTYVYGEKKGKWTSIALTQYCLRMATEPENEWQSTTQNQYALVARFE